MRPFLLVLHKEINSEGQGSAAARPSPLEVAPPHPLGVLFFSRYQLIFSDMIPFSKSGPFQFQYIKHINLGILRQRINYNCFKKILRGHKRV